MASSNVHFYERQKELQDTIANCEQQRANLDLEFRRAIQVDETSSKMKATRLHTYWKKICEDERRAKQRNEMLLREFQRIDTHMSEMNARTQKLALMKKQYEDYIARTYPQWNELMNGLPKKQQQEPPTDDQSQFKSSTTSKQNQPSQQNLERSNAESPLSNTQVSINHKTQENSVVKTDDRLSVRANIPRTDSSKTKLKDQQPEHGEQVHHEYNEDSQFQYKKEGHAHKPGEYNEQDEIKPSGIYANLPLSNNDHGDQLDLRNQPEKEETIQQPNKIDKKNVHPNRSAESQSRPPDKPTESLSKSMVPLKEDDEASEFMTDSDLPMANSLGNTQVKPFSQNTREVESTKIKKTSGSIKPELSVDGLLNLLKVIESDMVDAFSHEGYYRSSWPNTAQKNDIIRKANAEDDLTRVDANLISMVVLEQITLIVRSLDENCLLPENLLQGNVSTLTATTLRNQLSPKGQIIWDALWSHFTKLVKQEALEPKELSAIFTPCLVADGGSQDKGHQFICYILEELNTEKPGTPQWNTSVSPGNTLGGSGSLMEDGRVPPLKFGSLLDKPFSDDESSYLTTSIPRDTIPLNETDAYKSMVSSTTGLQPRRQSSTQEDTDDDVEKQIASAISKKPVSQLPAQQRILERDDPSETSSQTMQTSSHVYVPSAFTPRKGMNKFGSGQPRFGVKISSDLDTDTEVDAGIFGSSKKIEDDFDFYD
ncbi:unnamed protein product [Lymnaea stagnalis]|uniref:Centrosomal protein kizuna n=1 Tax=Lymnaea stagnalis TaxID=6523 RepID=A0AAV2I381_LYMST